MTYIEYLHALTLPSPAPVQPAAQLAVVPKPASVILCARYLGTRQMRLPDGRYIVREMWTHAHFRYIVSLNGFAMIEDYLGIYYVRDKHVRFANEITDYSVAILKAS